LLPATVKGRRPVTTRDANWDAALDLAQGPTDQVQPRCQASESFECMFEL
jgi:hypothetical protein